MRQELQYCLFPVSLRSKVPKGLGMSSVFSLLRSRDQLLGQALTWHQSPALHWREGRLFEAPVL